MSSAPEADVEICQGCEAIERIYQSFFHPPRRNRQPLETDYANACSEIEQQAEDIAHRASVSMAGMEAKARVVRRLADVGMAIGYAERILASSLASDVLKIPPHQKRERRR